MTQSGQGRKQSSPLDDRVKRCTSQRIQFLYGQVFSSAFATLNTFRLGRKVCGQIAVYKSLFEHRLEYREVSGRRIGWYGAGLEPATFGTQQIEAKFFNQLQVNLRKRYGISIDKNLEVLINPIPCSTDSFWELGMPFLFHFPEILQEVVTWTFQLLRLFTVCICIKKSVVELPLANLPYLISIDTSFLIQVWFALDDAIDVSFRLKTHVSFFRSTCIPAFIP